VVEATRARGILHLGLERMPRITRAQSMDVLSSQATIAGYAAVLLGSTHIGTLLPMLTTAAGTIRPARVLVVGAGVAGLQAIATAKRLGAVIEASDVRPSVKAWARSSMGSTSASPRASRSRAWAPPSSGLIG
jgi:H+-translocating NAD(P) transhydrogenase subunit alpha